MSLDGAFLRHLKNELERNIVGRRIYKIYQPSKHEIVLLLRGRDDIAKLIISASAEAPRINITKRDIDNPTTPPPLCMLFRKKIMSAKITGIEQKFLERAVYINLETKDEMGYNTSYKIAVEIMGKYSNAILIDANGKIVDAIKRVTSHMSSKRLVLPGILYEEPPKQDKLCVLNVNGDEIINKVKSFSKEKTLYAALMSCMQGISGIICHYLIRNIGYKKDVTLSELASDDIKNLKRQINMLSNVIRDAAGRPYLIENADGKRDISFIKFEENPSQEYNSFSELVDDYYSEKAHISRVNSRAGALIKNVENLISSKKKKIIEQTCAIEECSGKEKFRLYGDLLIANVYKLKKGMESVNLLNFFSDSGEELNIKLDSKLDGSQNAQRYYKKYKKAKTAEKVLSEQINSAKNDILYLENILDNLERSESEAEIQAIYQELSEQKYIKPKNKFKVKIKTPEPIKFTSPSGYDILVGRNCKQNEKLTYKTAGKKDLWFHAKDIPGGHTIMFTGGAEATPQDILFAAEICAGHSKARNSTNVAVDYTVISNVKKPANYKPGMAIYKNYQTLYVKPNRE